MRAPTTTVVLPVRDRGDLADVVLRDLHAERIEQTEVFVMDNGSGPETVAVLEAHRRAGTTVMDAAGLTLAQMWRVGWEAAAMTARDLGQRRWEVAFVNSDVHFLPGTITQMREVLRSEGLGAVCPDYARRTIEGRTEWKARPATGSYRHGGLCGWCFMLAGELHADGLEVDTRYEIWCGDDDLFFQVEALGQGLAVVEGLPLDHVGGATVAMFPELEEAKGRDMDRLREKWGPR